MDIGSIFLILALAIPIVIFIIRPLIERNAVTVTRADQDISTLLAERDQVVATLQELDDDYNLGKIPSGSYPTQRIALLQTGAGILRQIDEYHKASNSQAPEDRLESALQAHRLALSGASAAGRKNGNAVPPVPDDDLEQMIASRRRAMQSKAGGFCPKCGKPVQASDRFCPKCGATLT